MSAPVSLLPRSRPPATTRDIPRSALATHLSPRIIAEWEARLGIGAAPARTRARRFSGATGLAAYSPTVDIRVTDHETFHAMRFSSALSTFTTYCALRPAAVLERTAERTRTEPAESLLVSVNGMRGRSIIRQDGREYSYGPGDLTFISNVVPYRIDSSAVADPAGILIPFSRLGKHRHIAERLQRPVAANTPLARAASVFVRRFAAETAVLGANSVGAASEHAAVDLIIAALSEFEGASPTLEDSTLFVQEAARDLIERHHRDPSFSPDAIAEHLHLSRRQLYRYFESCEHSLAGRIAERRLHTAHEMLVENPSTPINTVALSSGFPTVATFRNRFKARYGVGPVEYRYRLHP